MGWTTLSDIAFAMGRSGPTNAIGIILDVYLEQRRVGPGLAYQVSWMWDQPAEKNKSHPTISCEDLIIKTLDTD